MPVINIRNGLIKDISRDRDNTLVTVTYSGCQCDRRNDETVRLVVGPRTTVLNRNGAVISAGELRVGMTVNASFSSTMTRSIPPQAVAFLIRIVDEPRRENVVVGTIVDMDRRNRSFTTISDRDVSSIIRFNVPEDARIIGRNGSQIEFSRLMPGMNVRVRHADFMTASIPPQTTAIEIRVL
ncbi:MAG: hypothetical protein IJ324_00030 [Lachnospiraceae bacterium]|nr:hypothetical protein [Lachnospiraceae bacterium]